MDHRRFGRFIGEMRKRKGYTQRQLADLLFVTDKAVSKWECGLGFPDIKILQPLSEALGVSLSELMDAKLDDGESVGTRDANQLLETTLDCSVREVDAVKFRARAALLLLFIGSCVLVNLGYGGAIGWLLGDRFSYNPPFQALYDLRHLAAAAALGFAALMCRPRNVRKWERLSMIGCVASIACLLVAIVCHGVTYGREGLERIDGIALISVSLSLSFAVAAMCRARHNCKQAARLLYGSAACMFATVLAAALLQSHISPLQACIKSVALSSPMALLAACMRLLPHDHPSAAAG